MFLGAFVFYGIVWSEFSVLSIKVFLGWRQPVRFTDFLAETVFWEFSFFNRNYKKWLYLKNFQTSNLFSSESTLLLSAAWVVLQSKQSMFQRIFLKKSQFIVISDEKRQFSKHHFSQKVCETDRSQTAYLGTGKNIFSKTRKVKLDLDTYLIWINTI